jgi:hypothetical protein
MTFEEAMNERELNVIERLNGKCQKGEEVYARLDWKM